MKAKKVTYCNLSAVSETGDLRSLSNIYLSEYKKNHIVLAAKPVSVVELIHADKWGKKFSRFCPVVIINERPDWLG